MVFVFFAAGCLEIVSILFRPISLGFRLYGNIFAGENMMEAMARLVPAFGGLVPIPFSFLELLMALVQAMVFIFLLMQVEPGGQVEQIAKTFGVDWSHLIAQIISFCIVCALLYRFAYGPILKMLEERRQQIAQRLADTEKIKAELARTEAQRQE